MSRIGAPIEIGASNTVTGGSTEPCGRSAGEGNSLAACGLEQDGAKGRRQKTELGQLPFLIRRDGTWFYQGTPVNRKELVCLFASVLQREADGSWWLNTPVERGQIEVEDAPFVAVELDWSGDGHQQILSFRTNVDEVITAGADNPIRVSHDLMTCDPVPYIRVRAGAGALAIEARISRAVYYELVALSVTELVGGRLMQGVWSQGSFFALGEAPQDTDEDDWLLDDDDAAFDDAAFDDAAFDEACDSLRADMTSDKT